MSEWTCKLNWKKKHKDFLHVLQRNDRGMAK